MKRAVVLAAAIFFWGRITYAQGQIGSSIAFTNWGPDSMEQEGVPHGKIVGPLTLPCQVYPGTAHTYWVYVPAQYDPAKPASLMIFNDGQAFKNEKGDVRAQNVMDNLIYRREIPVMLGVFINPGKTPEQPEPTPKDWGDRSTNRPTEYNTPDDKYARIICDELLPVLYKKYNISKDPEQRGIGGASSGAIAAFMVAWERPDQFRKVISIVGSFTNLRGGHVYPERVLASEKKPIRIFFQDGRNDNRGQRQGRQVRPQPRLVLSERPAGRCADQEGLRRQLRLGHRPARPKTRRRHPPRNDAGLARPSGIDRRDQQRGTLVQPAGGDEEGLIAMRAALGKHDFPSIIRRKSCAKTPRRKEELAKTDSLVFLCVLAPLREIFLFPWFERATFP